MKFIASLCKEKYQAVGKGLIRRGKVTSISVISNVRKRASRSRRGDALGIL